MKQNEQLEFKDISVQTESDDEKREKKQKLIRNEFQAVGKYGIPLIKKQNIDLSKIEPWGYTKTKVNDEENKNKTIHFFTQDWLFEMVYSKPEAAMEKLDQYYALFTPDFSLYANMPLALQLYSTFKNRWCGAFWQKQGMKVVPTLNWSTPDSFDFCFDGVEKGSVVAVSTYYAEGYEKEFMTGYNKMLEVIQPSAILCYGDPFPKMKGNIKTLSPYNHNELIQKLGFNEYVKRFMEGDIYPSN